MKQSLGVFRTALAVVALAVLVSACAVREHRPAGAWMDERQAWFAAHPDWSVSGRVAIREGQRGGSLAFDWRARGDVHSIQLRTVTGGKQWRLEFRPGYAELDGSDVGRLIGTTPDPLVEAAVGWPIPVSYLTDWIRGLASPDSEQVMFSSDGTIRRIVFDPWDLVYQRFEAVNGQLMPTRLEAESPPYRVRLVLREWDWQ